ncbi:MAG: ankyrin repeat domain-containing protein [archaeon]|nr:ankyrin repeat domain-containing protein [archaeon]
MSIENNIAHLQRESVLLSGRSTAPSFYDEDSDMPFHLGSAEAPSLRKQLVREKEYFDSLSETQAAAVPVGRLRTYWHLRHCVLQEAAQLGDTDTLGFLISSYQVVSSGTSGKLQRQLLLLTRARGIKYKAMPAKHRQMCLSLVDLDWPNPAGETSVWLAAATSGSCFATLIQAGATVPLPNTAPYTPSILHNATILSSFGDHRALSYALDVLNVKPDQSNPYGDTALHFAAARGCMHACKCLIDKGANLNKRNPASATPLAFAVRHGCYDISQYLLDNRSKVKGSRGIVAYGESMLHYLARRSDAPLPLLHALVDAGCKITRWECGLCAKPSIDSHCNYVDPRLIKSIKQYILDKSQKRGPAPRLTRKSSSALSLFTINRKPTEKADKATFSTSHPSDRSSTGAQSTSPPAESPISDFVDAFTDQSPRSASHPEKIVPLAGGEDDERVDIHAFPPLSPIELADLLVESEPETKPTKSSKRSLFSRRR